MVEREDWQLEAALEAALVAADASGDTLIAARIADCLAILLDRKHRPSGGCD